MTGTLNIECPPAARMSGAASFAPLFRAEWCDALFIHFRMDPSVLQPLVPLELDLYDGRAYVSLVAFTQARLRPAFGGRWTAWAGRPLARHPFLNLRTYVRRPAAHDAGERAIYFMAEWVPNRLAVFLAPRLYGLPYRLGRLSYRASAGGDLLRDVTAPDGCFQCAARMDPAAVPRPCEAGGESAFLLERYAAYTCRKGVVRRFRIRHHPWAQVRAAVTVRRCDLLGDVVLGDPCGANYAAGPVDVSIGAPEREGRALARRGERIIFPVVVREVER